MCGRYALWDLQAASEHFNVPPREFEEIIQHFMKNYNSAPTQFLPTVTADTKSRHMQLMRWGLVAPWMKDYKDTFKYSTFNARSEDIFQKPLWKKAIRETRCIVPANGFYEWKPTADGKQPFYVRPKNQKIFGFAGIYSKWEDAEGHSWPTYSIITTVPNNQMKDIHNRMPVILHKKDENRWLDSSLHEQQDLFDILQPYEDGGLEIVKVSRDVNNSRNNSPSLIHRI